MLEFDSELATTFPTIANYAPSFALITSLRTQALHRDHFLQEWFDFLSLVH